MHFLKIILAVDGVLLFFWCLDQCDRRVRLGNEVEKWASLGAFCYLTIAACLMCLFSLFFS